MCDGHQHLVHLLGGTKYTEAKDWSPLSLSATFLAASKLEDKMVHRLSPGHGMTQFALIKLSSLPAQDMVAMTKRPGRTNVDPVNAEGGEKNMP